MKLLPHHEYKVKGMNMFFYYKDGDCLVFYYYIENYGKKEQIIYYKNHDLKPSEIEKIQQPLIRCA